MNYDMLKKSIDFAKVMKFRSEIRNLVSDVKYLQDVERNLTIFLITNRIAENDVSTVMEKLVCDFNTRYHTNYIYSNDYHFTINLLINNINRVINKKWYKAFIDKAIDKELSNIMAIN